MMFYRVEGEVARSFTINDREERRSLALSVQEICTTLQKENEKRFFFVSRIGKSITAACITMNGAPKDADVDAFWQKIGVPVDTWTMKETTLRALRSMLHGAEMGSYIEDECQVLSEYGIPDLNSRHFGVKCRDQLCDLRTKPQILKAADIAMFGRCFTDEIERIYQGRKVKDAIGHPVHYLITADDPKDRGKMASLLVSALLDRNRITSRRYHHITLCDSNSASSDVIDQVYGISADGAVVVSYDESIVEEGEFAYEGSEIISSMCETINRFSLRVLTILCVPRKDVKARDAFYRSLNNVTLVELNEEGVSAQFVRKELTRQAKLRHTAPDDALLGQFADDAKVWRASDAHRLFDLWYSRKLREEVYPQYSKFDSVQEVVAKEAPRGSAYERLQEMIGLAGAKEIIGQALDYFKAQKLYKPLRDSTSHPAMHMVFTGNPGTAKTSVARLFAQIMKENDLLTNGTFLEVGRSDLVGKYVGWTAKIVKEMFQAARGGVLFIDEAYSLLEGETGLYGDEAINTIVQEMENHRDDVVVIFAGYPAEMEAFLARNPGLRSRIAFHVPFEDYTPDELWNITKLIAKDKGYQVEAMAREKLFPIFAAVSAQADFGNGRYARNLVERAEFRQASRLVRELGEKATSEQVRTLTAADFEEISMSTVPLRRVIGF